MRCLNQEEENFVNETETKKLVCRKKIKDVEWKIDEQSIGKLTKKRCSN